MTDSQCPICESKQTKKLFNIISPYLSKDLAYEINKCKQCQVAFAVGDVSDELLKKIYGDAFHDSSQQTAEIDEQGEFTEKGLQAAIVRNAKDRVSWLTQKKLQGTLLDVGAGKGYFVKVAQGAFSPQGVELSVKAVDYAKKMNCEVVAGGFLSTDISEEKFDVITLWDVLAGFADPLVVVGRLKAQLKPGGSLVFTVPNCASIMAKFSGKYWPLWIPPVNLVYFNKNSIEKMLGKVGLEVVEISFIKKYISLQFLYIKIVRSFKLFFLEKLKFLVPASIKVNANFNNIITVIAKKGDS